MKQQTMKQLKDLFDLSGKIAVVTGGLGHLGFAMTETLLELGANVIVTVAPKEMGNTKITEKLSGLKQRYPQNKVSTQEIDFFNDNSIKSFFAKVEKEQKRIDILINNAFAGVQKPIETMSFDEFESSLSGALSSVFKCSMLALPLMKKNPSISSGQVKGVIINITSMYGIVAPDWKVYKGTQFNSTASYGPSKAGVIQLTRYLASYWANYGIRVNSISPGPFPNSENIKDKKFLKRLEEKTMLNRIGEPQDLKGVIALLASDASSYITGQNFIVDGGWTAW
jgi:NAD(P)-dependent dehydrogenase (short-subunit alcohol dehydrogenase family)